MKKYFLLASSNIKKSKSQMITVMALILIASIFLNIWLVLSIDYKQNYSLRSGELNAEQALVTFSAYDDDFTQLCQNTLKADSDVESYEIFQTISSNSSVKYSVGKVSGYFSFISRQDVKNKQIGKYKFLESENNFTQNTIYIPYLFHTGGGYQKGDAFEIEFGQTTLHFTVGGFFENMMAGSMNGGVVSLVIHEDTFQTMSESLSQNSTQISIKIKSGVDDKKYTSNFVEKVSMQRLVPYFSTWESINKQARTFISEIAGGIIALVAVLITFIVLIMIAFNISNKVEEEMKSLGVLKGIGYKSGQIILSILLQFLVVAMLACIVGIALSYAVIPLIANLLITQTGVIWKYGFSVVSALCTLLIVGAVVTIIALLASVKIKKLSPMTALREGIETHNFKKNILPLEKNKLNVHIALGLKSMQKNKRQGVAIAVILSVLTFVGVFAGALYSNVAVDTKDFISTITGESADAVVIAKEETLKKFSQL